MVFFLRLVNIFPSNLLGVSFVWWRWWPFALCGCFWVSSGDTLQRGAKNGDKRVCLFLYTHVHSSCAGFLGFMTFSKEPMTP